MKRYLIVGVLVILVALTVTAVAMAKPPDEFSMKKLCTGEPVANACWISDAEYPFDVLNGGLIYYNDRALFGNPAGDFEIAKVELVSPNGSTLGGQIRWVRDHGYFTFGQGTGDLAGVHATGRIEFLDVINVDDLLFSLSGTYHINP